MAIQCLGGDVVVYISSYLCIRDVNSLCKCSKWFRDCMYHSLQNLFCVPSAGKRCSDSPFPYWIHRLLLHDSLPIYLCRKITIFDPLLAPCQTSKMLNILGLCLRRGLFQSITDLHVYTDNNLNGTVSAFNFLYDVAVAASLGFCGSLCNLSVSLGPLLLDADDVNDKETNAMKCDVKYTVENVYMSIAKYCNSLRTISGSSLLTSSMCGAVSPAVSNDSYSWPMLEVLDIGHLFKEFMWDSEDEDDVDYQRFFRQFTRTRYPRLTKLLIHFGDEDSNLIYMFIQHLILSMGEVASDNVVEYAEYIFPYVNAISLEYGEIGCSFFDELVEWKRVGLGRVGRNTLTVAQSNTLLPDLFPSLRQFYCYNWLPSVQLLYMMLPLQGNPDAFETGFDLVFSGNGSNPALCDFLRNHYDRVGWKIRSLMFINQSFGAKENQAYRSRAAHYGCRSAANSPHYALLQIPGSIDCADALNSSVLGDGEESCHINLKAQDEVDCEDWFRDGVEHCSSVMESLHVAMRNCCRGLGLLEHVQHLQVLEEFLCADKGEVTNATPIIGLGMSDFLEDCYLKSSGAVVAERTWLETAFYAAASLSCCPLIRSIILHSHGHTPFGEYISRVGLLLGCILLLACGKDEKSSSSDPLFKCLETIDVQLCSFDCWDGESPVGDILESVASSISSRMMQITRGAQNRFSIRLRILRHGVFTGYHTVPIHCGIR